MEIKDLNDLKEELKDLNATERTALVALVRASVLSDGNLSESESSAFDLLIAAFGEEGYRAAAEAATEAAHDEQSLRALLAQVENANARELIYGTLLEVSSSETVDAGEGALLDLVGEVFGIRPQFEEFPAEEGVS